MVPARNVVKAHKEVKAKQDATFTRPSHRTSSIDDRNNSAKLRQQPTPPPERVDVEDSITGQNTNEPDIPIRRAEQPPEETSLNTQVSNPNSGANLTLPLINTFSECNRATNECKTVSSQLPSQFVDLTLAECQKNYDISRYQGLRYEERTEIVVDHGVAFIADALKEAGIRANWNVFQNAMHEVIKKFLQQNREVGRKRKYSLIGRTTSLADSGAMNTPAAGKLVAHSLRKRLKVDSTAFHLHSRAPSQETSASSVRDNRHLEVQQASRADPGPLRSRTRESSTSSSVRGKLRQTISHTKRSTTASRRLGKFPAQTKIHTHHFTRPFTSTPSSTSVESNQFLVSAGGTTANATASNLSQQPNIPSVIDEPKQKYRRCCHGYNGHRGPLFSSRSYKGLPIPACSNWTNIQRQNLRELRRLEKMTPKIPKVHATQGPPAVN
jgi:hypothetical protein